MPRIKTPNGQKQETLTLLKRTEIDNFLKSQTIQFIDFEAVRAAAPVGWRAELTDGVIMQICADLGYQVTL